MNKEHLSDLSAIALHYGERALADEVCQAFVQSHLKRLFNSSLILHKFSNKTSTHCFYNKFSKKTFDSSLFLQ